jgi:S-adenosylmethionine decarboxylase
MTEEVPLGRHLLATIQASPNILNHPERLTCAALDACNAGGATVIGCHSHKFEPHGVTAFVILAESHFSIHTWPERGTAALDIFTCGEKANPFVIFSTFLSLVGGQKKVWHMAPRVL